MAADEHAADGRRAGWRLHEPTTTLTDLAIAVVAGWLAARLVASTAATAPRLLAGGFAVLALTALVGAVVHGVGPSLGERRKRPLWLLTLQLALVTNALLLGAVVLADAPADWRPALLAAVGAKLAAFAVLAWRRADFRWVVYDSLLTLAGVAAAEGAMWALHGAASAPWMLAGVGVSVAAGLLQHLRVAPHRHFNHNDLYHVVQLAAVVLFYRGGLLLAAR